MLRVQAAREAMPGVRYPADTLWQREFEAEFPYEETEDQLSAIASIKSDMASARPMDRLICGDVGFGKTEVAIRAAFKAVEFGKQVAVLVPTTVLAEQHEPHLPRALRRLPLPGRIALTLQDGQNRQEILKRVARGEVDVLVGTHRILSKDVDFADLGLVIVDEEQALRRRAQAARCCSCAPRPTCSRSRRRPSRARCTCRCSGCATSAT